MTIRIIIIFLIITTGNCLNYRRVNRQFINSTAQNKSEDINLSFDSTIKMDQSLQHPNNLFKNKKEFVKLAEQHIKNQKIYSYKQYKSHNNSKKTHTFNKEYVNIILSSLALLPKPHIINSTTESATKYPAVRDNLTSIDMQPTTTKNIISSTFNNKNEINLTESTHLVNSTTPSLFVEELTTEAANSDFRPATTEIKDRTENMENYAILESSTENYGESTGRTPVKEESQSEHISSLATESSINKKVIYSVYPSTKEEEMPSTTNFNTFDLDTTINSLDLSKIEELTNSPITTEVYEKLSTINYKDVSPTKENSNSFTTETTDLKTEVYERTTGSNFVDSSNAKESSIYLSTKSFDITTEKYENPTTLQYTGERYVLTWPSSLSTVTRIYESLNITDSTTPSISSETASEKPNKLDLENGTENITKLTDTIESATENVMEHIQSTRRSELTEPILDTTYERFEPITSISFNEVTTEIFETATKKSTFSEEIVTDISTRKTGEFDNELKATENSAVFITVNTQPVTANSEYQMEGINANVTTNYHEATTELYIHGSTTQLVGFSTVASMQAGATKTSKSTDIAAETTNKKEFGSEESTTPAMIDFNGSTANVRNELTTDYYLKSEDFINEISPATTISYNRPKIPISDSEKYDRKKISENIEESQMNEKIESKKPIRKAKKLKYATDVMPSLGDYDI